MGTSNGEKKTVQRELPVKLTESELVVIGAEMADTELEIADKVVVRQAMNAKILELGKRRRKLATKIDTGTEARLVSCRIEEDFAKNVRRFFREDTGEEVDTEALTAEDRQTELEGADAPKKGKSAKERKGLHAVD